MLCPICYTSTIKEGEACCAICYFSGKLFESYLLDVERGNMLGRIRALPGVSSAAVWHHGNNLFQLGVILEDARLVMPGFAIATNDGLTVMPGVPPMLDRWAVAVVDQQTNGATILAESYSDDELVEVIEQISEGTLPVDAEQIII